MSYVINLQHVGLFLIFGSLVVLPLMSVQNMEPKPTRRKKQPKPMHYDLVTRVLHFIFAVFIVYASIAGYALHFISNHTIHDFLSKLNMSVATVLLVLLPVRFAWRLLRVEPASLKGLPDWQMRFAHDMHGFIYLAMTMVLVTGYLMVPDGYYFFGLFFIPTPFAAGEITHGFFMVHRFSCALLACLVLLHVAGALKNTVKQGWGFLERMF